MSQRNNERRNCTNGNWEKCAKLNLNIIVNKRVHVYHTTKIRPGLTGLVGESNVPREATVYVIECGVSTV